MKNYYLILIFCFFSYLTYAQVTLFDENFNATNKFTLNTSGSGGNTWIVNNQYIDGFGIFGDTPFQISPITGFPNSNYLHIYNASVCGFGACNALFDTGSASNRNATMTNNISTTGYSAVSFSFWYLCEGASGTSFGKVEYSTDGGTIWTTKQNNINGVSGWTQLILTDVAFDNRPQLKFRFNWTNGGSGADPAFSVDDVVVKGTFVPAVATKVKLFSDLNAIPTFYDTLKEAFDAVNAGTYQGVVSIEIYGDTTETAKATLNASASGLALYSSLSIKPIGGVRTVSGNFASELIGLNGADNVTIDGLIAGVKSLTISNTSTSGTSGTSTIQFRADATNNIVTNCNVLGSSTTSVVNNGGNIWFGAAAITTGNDNNTISNCDIGPAGSNLPTKGIYCTGTSSGVTPFPINNSGNTFTNNNIFDFFSATERSIGIYITTGTTATSITNNKFYQTASRTFTSGQTHCPIYIANTTSAQNFTITGNTIGYANNAGTGTYSLTATGTGTTSKFYGIYFNGMNSGIVSNINNNFIANISVTGMTSSGTANANPFALLYIEKGVVTSNDNTFGNQTALNSIVYSTNSTTATEVYGAFNNNTNNAWIATSNNFGGITVNNAAISGNFILSIMKTATGIAGTLNATSNIIGGTIANSINNTSSSTGTVQNIGIWTISTILTSTSNTIRNLTAQTGQINQTLSASVIGILANNTSVNHTISKNTIYGLSNSNTGNVTNGIVGIIVSGNNANVVEKNLIFGMSILSTNPAATIMGICGSNGTTTYSNNMIALGSGINNSVEIRGIYEFIGNGNYYHNSVYIGGNPTSGSGNSFALKSTVTVNTRNIINNIFWNARNNSGATGKNYCIQVGGTSANPPGLTINNNIYYATATGAVFGLFNSLDVISLNAWQTAVGQDSASYDVNPNYINPTNVFPDLHLNNPNCDSGNTGIPVIITTDYDNQTRSSTNPTIGADETIPSTYNWNGSWTPSGTPNINSAVIFNSSYDMTSLPNVDACSVTINGATTVVTVSANKYLNIKNDLTINTGAILNVLNNGSLVQINDSATNTNNGTGIANVTRNTTQYQQFDYTYFSSPVFEPTIGSALSAWRQNYSFEYNAANFLDLYSGLGNQTTGFPDTFDDNSDDWIRVLQTTPMVSGKGYAIMENSAGPFPVAFTPVTFSGKPNNGLVTIPLLLSPGIVDPNDDFNLVGNPYASAISANDFINANLPNISGTLYFWTHKDDVLAGSPGPNVYNYTNDDYAYYNLSGGIATALTIGTGSNTGSAVPTGFIASGQGFMVDAQNTNPLVFNNAMRLKTYDNTNFWRTSNPTGKDRIWLNLTNTDGMLSQQLIGYFDNATLDHDQAYDAKILPGNSTINFYSSSQNDFYKIQAKPTFNNNDEVALGYTCSANGNFTIAIDNKEGVLNETFTNIYLQDNMLNIVHDLKQSAYNFTSSYGTNNSRFVLKYQNASLYNNTFVNDDNNVIITVKDSKFNILSKTENIKSIQVFDILGRNIYDNQTVNSKAFAIQNLVAKNQTLIVKIKLENGEIVTRKIIL